MYFPLLSIGDVLETALLNTVLGMGVVFFVLIFISLIISLFTYIPKIQKIFQKEEPEQETQTVPVSRPTSLPVKKPAEEQKSMDDLELIAVITAAIAASTGIPKDQFVVKSIRRSKSNHWNDAI